MEDNQKEVLKAWIDGEDCEFRYAGTDMWANCTPFVECTDVCFLRGVEYRIKPKNIVTFTRIETYADRNMIRHTTYSEPHVDKNLRLTWSPDGKTLLKAEVI